MKKILLSLVLVGLTGVVNAQTNAQVGANMNGVNSSYTANTDVNNYDTNPPGDAEINVQSSQQVQRNQPSTQTTGQIQDSVNNRYKNRESGSSMNGSSVNENNSMNYRNSYNREYNSRYTSPTHNIASLENNLYFGN